jgi:hypothetical protein
LDSPIPAPAALTRRHLLTISLLVLAYSGYYFCRSDLSVVLSLLIRDLGQHDIPANVAQVRLGFIASAGVLAYALGKFVSGALADLFGGRNNFLGGMASAVFFTMLFALGGGFPIFTLAWMGNRLLQSSGWVGLVKVSSRRVDVYSKLMKQGCSAELCGAERVPLDLNRIIPAWEVFETRPVPIGFALREHLLFPRPLFRPDSRGTHVRNRFRRFNSA